MIDSVGVAAAGIGPGAAGAAGNARNGQDLGKEEFLKLLVTQLEQQDPLNPQDGAEFVAQLSQFSSLERLLNIETALGNVAMASLATNSTLAAGLIGKDVHVAGDSFEHGQGLPSELTYRLDGAAEKVTIEVRDEAGTLVDTVETSGKAGENSFTWSGLVTKDDVTSQAETGKYTFSVKAETADGDTVGAHAQSVARVVAVNFMGGVAELVLSNGETVSMDKVSQIAEPAPPAPALPPVPPAESGEPNADTDNDTDSNPEE